METGTVLHYNPAGGKKYGFVRTDAGEELFFHFNDGRAISFKDGPVFLENTKPPESPRKDDVIFFTRAEGREGQKASPWGFEFQLRQAKRKVGLELLRACPELVERFPCLPALFAEAKRPGDREPFTVSVKEINSDIHNRYGLDHYPSGVRVIFYVLTKADDGSWQYKMLPYAGFRTWQPNGVGRDYELSSSSVYTYVQNLGIAWSSPLAVLEVDTSRTINRGSSSDLTPVYTRMSAENGGVYNHSANLYLVS